MTPLLLLESVLRNGRVASVEIPSTDKTWGLHHAAGRLARSLQNSEFGLDHAVLLRQCLRLLEPEQSVVVAHVSPDVEKNFDAVGLRRAIDGTVKALPFAPAWQRGPAPEGVDVPARACVVDDDPMPGEAWLGAHLGKHSWRSQAQREASWEALTAQPNSTLLVGLPTGAGKSLVYQVCAAFQPGLTVVVVPTVALGLDQIKALRAMPIAETHTPLLYTSDEHALDVLEAVRTKQCRLLITSPEAIVAGRLGSVLASHVQDAWLSRLVIDEAHIVDSWGASFRVEFQLLGAWLRQWREQAPQGIRTILLSATFGPGTTETLKTLFTSDGVPWNEYVIQRLRPEMHYFSPGQSLPQDTHENVVIEALLQLPRPAILYLTERREADHWLGRLSQLGLKRLACFHGETSQADRNRILDAWRDDRLDLIVATSAFGMGVDKPDVRTVLHACFPENIDRYYQEVGRGGRDGAASVAVALWTDADRSIGGSMGPTLLKDGVKIRGRWAAMWNQRQATEKPEQFRVPLWASPDYKLHERTYEESITWNKRLLLMMERAGLLRIQGMDIEPSEDGQDCREWAMLEMLRGTINLEAQLPALLHQTRTVELRALAVGRKRLDDLLSNGREACRILREHYGRSTYRTCGSCASCRHDPSIRAGTMPLVLRLQQPATQPRVDIVHGPSTNSKKHEDKVVLALRRVMQERLACRFVTGERFHEKVRSLMERACNLGNISYRLDLLTGDASMSVRPDELVVCLHERVIHPQSDLLHAHGAVCAHWILGAPTEESSGSWPFLHQHDSRLFGGQDALNDWITSRLNLRSHSRGLDSVH
jgi:ATP-dependent DNA helicase RecQ